MLLKKCMLFMKIFFRNSSFCDRSLPFCWRKTLFGQLVSYFWCKCWKFMYIFKVWSYLNLFLIKLLQYLVSWLLLSGIKAILALKLAFQLYTFLLIIITIITSFIFTNFWFDNMNFSINNIRVLHEYCLVKNWITLCAKSNDSWHHVYSAILEKSYCWISNCT